MLRSCGDSSVATSVGLSLLLLLLLLACGVGCAWYRKCRDTRQFAFPRFLQRGGRGGRDYSKTLSLRRQGGGSRYKVPARTQAHRPAASDPDLCNDYENWEVGPALAEEGRKGLYENMQPPRLEEPVYGNEAWSHYCNVQKPLSPETPQEEDIYIVPD
ncbi:protein GAPT [Pteronotus mesoamericanus]|uniref:protein GAPT n=1 Tax=Pteronotus mesoamericanus TaxID=1884717 RepID=UPI0023EB06F7|nr:protein GAPT [Pteronotus parnellii mesoamericanus]